MRTKPHRLRDGIEEKHCTKCDTWKPLAQFYPSGRTRDRLYPSCRSCHAARCARWVRQNPERQRAKTKRFYNANPDKVRGYSMKHRYGVVLESYTALVAAQGNRCAICGGPPDRRILAVDHDHETNVVRGLLCNGCNAGMGMLKDDPDLLRRAADYIESHRRKAKAA